MSACTTLTAVATPQVRYVKDGVSHVLNCDFIAGCDGFHGVARASVPKDAITEYEKVYPFGWLGVLADVPPVSNPCDCVCQQRPRLCIVLDAQHDPQSLLRAMPLE